MNLNSPLAVPSGGLTAADIDAAIADKSTLQARRAEYVSRLIRHDWDYAYSDDYNAFLRGQRERDALNALQSQVDPDYALWNKHAPEGYRREVRA